MLFTATQLSNTVFSGFNPIRAIFVTLPLTFAQTLSSARLAPRCQPGVLLPDTPKSQTLSTKLPYVPSVQ